jgi:hypothetical protein
MPRDGVPSTEPRSQEKYCGAIEIFQWWKNVWISMEFKYGCRGRQFFLAPFPAGEAAGGFRAAAAGMTGDFGGTVLNSKKKWWGFPGGGRGASRF